MSRSRLVAKSPRAYTASEARSPHSAKQGKFFVGCALNIMCFTLKEKLIKTNAVNRKRLSENLSFELTA